MFSGEVGEVFIWSYNLTLVFGNIMVSQAATVRKLKGRIHNFVYTWNICSLLCTKRNY